MHGLGLAPGAEVDVADWDGNAVRTTVIAAARGRVTVAAPPGAAPVGADLLLSWSGPRGVSMLPTRLAASRQDTWRLVVTAEPWTEQRRAFVRIALDRPVTLRPMTLRIARPDGPAARVDGKLVDVSEAALQCTLSTRSDDARLGAGVRVMSHFLLRDTEFLVPGWIHARRQVMPSAPAHLIVRFDHTDRDADTLRREIFAIQLDSRRRPRE